MIASTLLRIRSPRFWLAATVLAVLAAGSLGVGAVHARKRPSLRHRVVVQLTNARHDITPVHRVKKSARARDRRQLERALRSARHMRWCAVASAVKEVDRVGRLRKRLARVDRLIKRKARHCSGRARKGNLGPPKRAKPGPGPSRPFLREHEQGRPPPLSIGRFRRRATSPGPPINASGVRLAKATARAAAVTDPLTIFAPTPTALPDPATNNFPLDPSTAASGDVALVTGNRYLAVSTDRGQTFAYLDPVKDVFGADDPKGGACCDQVVQYDPDTNRFYWLMQYWCDVAQRCGTRPGENLYRLAVASPQDILATGGRGGAWAYWDISSDDVGLSGDWMDYPDMGLGKNYLYITFNSPSAGGSRWLRIPKSTLRDETGNLGFSYFTTGDYLVRPVQSVGTTAFAVKSNSNSEIRLFTWDESSNKVHWDDVSHSSTPTDNCAAPDPSGKDFLANYGCGGQTSRIGGAALDGNGRDVWVAWTAGTDDRFPWAHIEVATINTRSKDTIRLRGIYSRTYAVGYPYLSSAPGGDVVMTYMTGGGSPKLFPGWAVAFLSNTESFVNVARGDGGATRVGDYLAVRPTSNNDFVATGNTLTAAGKFQPWYVVFGRSSDAPPAPPPKLRTITSLTATCPGAIDAGNAAQVTGVLSPRRQTVPIAVEFKSPSGNTTTVTATTGGASSYVAQANPSEIGPWQVKATYAGNADDERSSATCGFTVRAPQPGKLASTLTMTCPKSTGQE